MKKKEDFLVFILLTACIFIKCVLFNWFCFESILISSAWKEPLVFIHYYAAKLVPALMISSFVFITKHKIWPTVILLLIDAWIIANIVYFRANGLFVDVEAMKMTFNLKGFGSSIGAYFLPKYFWLVAISILYCILSLIIGWGDAIERRWCAFAVAFGLPVVYNLILPLSEWREVAFDEGFQFDVRNKREVILEKYGAGAYKLFVPFHEVKLYAVPGFSYCPTWQEEYIRENSILHYAIAMIVYDFNTTSGIQLDISDDLMQPFLSYSSTTPAQSNLIVVLVESLESWPLDIQQIANVAAPNLSRLLSSEHVFYCDRIRSEALHGVSGDGQMIVMSGLLPIRTGAACMMYDDSTYPSLAKQYHNTLLVEPCNGAWNQRKMSKNYGIRSEISRPDGFDEDVAFRYLVSSLDTLKSPSFSMIITKAMHSPFLKAQTPTVLPEDMPFYMKDYLCSLHTTDSCIGILMDAMETNPSLQNTTIVITGDHTVFKEALLKEFGDYGRENGFEIPTHESFTPLIIYSPAIEGQVVLTEMAYQMDIYPTILGLIGGNNYWQGLGVNLLDEQSRAERKIEEKEAYALSDQLIRSDWFRQYADSLTVLW